MGPKEEEEKEEELCQTTFITGFIHEHIFKFVC
jgi:hypothetical protein